MRDLDMILRGPGRPLLLEPRAAQALLDRALEERRGQGGSGLLSRALTAIGRIARPAAERDDEDDGVDRTRLALPAIAWAKDVEFGEGYAIVDGIAVLKVEGILTPDGYYDWWTECWVAGYAQIGAALAAAREDDRVRAILLRINSPGGLVDGCFDLAEAIAAGNAAAGGKPVWVWTNLACSAAYALAASADRIFASAEADVGSIGVVITHYDVSGWYEELGIRVEAIQSGARKTDGAQWKPLADDARAHLQGVVDQVARRFFGIVAAGRGTTPEAVSGLEAQWFLAHHDDPAQSGLHLGLVDAIGTERACFDALASSLSGETSTGAPAVTGEEAAATAARAGSPEKESDMSLKEQIEALRKKAAAGDTAAIKELKAMGVALRAETDTDDDDKDDDKEEAAESEDKDDDAAAEDDDDKEAEDDDEEPAARATGSKAGFALMGHKSARGREDLARELATKVAAKKLNYGEARKMLASAPRGSRLGATMDGRDHNPGRDGPNASTPGKGLAAAVDRLLEKKQAAR